MPKSLDLGFGIMMVVLGLYCLAFTPKANARFAALQQSGKLTEAEVRCKKKVLAAATVCSIILGLGAIIIHVFKLYD